MGEIKWESKSTFPEGDVYTFYDAGEETEYGYEIEVMYSCEECGDVTLNNWSFGYEEWSREVWSNWGDYVSQLIEECQGNIPMLDNALEFLDSIDCNYELYQPVEDRRAHLVDLETIKNLISSPSESVFIK